jgi:hypothetical protein
MDGTQTESRPNKGWAGVRGIDTSKWKREGPHHYHFPGGTTNLAACPLKPRERRGSVFIHGSRARTDRFPTIMGLRVPDYWTVVRVGALVEDPAVQQHVFRLVDGQVDGIAGHGRESLIAAGEMMR